MANSTRHISSRFISPFIKLNLVSSCGFRLVHHVIGSPKYCLSTLRTWGKQCHSSWVYEAGENAPPEPQFPLMALLVSGGHTELNLMTDHLTYQRLGATLDDAADEAFDEVARLLDLPYPGGPSIQKAAEEGDASRFHFPRAWLDNLELFLQWSKDLGAV